MGKLPRMKFKSVPAMPLFPSKREAQEETAAPPPKQTAEISSQTDMNMEYFVARTGYWSKAPTADKTKPFEKAQLPKGVKKRGRTLPKKEEDKGDAAPHEKTAKKRGRAPLPKKGANKEVEEDEEDTAPHEKTVETPVSVPAKRERPPVDDQSAPVAQSTRSRSMPKPDGVPLEDRIGRAKTTSPTTRKQKTIDEEEDIQIEIPPEVEEQPRNEAINTGPKTPFDGDSDEEIKAPSSDDEMEEDKGNYSDLVRALYSVDVDSDALSSDDEGEEGSVLSTLSSDDEGSDGLSSGDDDEEEDIKAITKKYSSVDEEENNKALSSDDEEENIKGILRKGKPGSGRRVAFDVDVKGGEGTSGEDEEGTSGEEEERRVIELDSDGVEVTYRPRTPPSDPPKENPLVALWECKCAGFEQLVEGIFGMTNEGEPVYTTHKAHRNCNYYKGENEPHDCGIIEMGLIWCDCTLSSYEPVLCLPFYRESDPVYS